MNNKDNTKTLDELLDLSSQFARVLDLAERNPAVKERKKKLAEPVLKITDDEDPDNCIVVGKRCAMHVLAVFRVADPSDLHDFVDTIMFKNPRNVVVSDAVISGIHPDGVKRVMRELDYKNSNEFWDKSIHDIVDLCMEVTTDNCLVFNEAHIMKHLDPIERNTVSAMAAKLSNSVIRPVIGYDPSI